MTRKENNNFGKIHLQWFADVEPKEPETTPEPEVNDEGSVELTKEIVEKWIESEEGGKWGISYTDKKVTSGLETFKKRTLPTLLQERENEIRKKLMPEETQEQVALKQIMVEREKEKKEAKLTELENFTIKRANALGLTNLGEQISYFIAPEEDETVKRLEWIIQDRKESYEKGRTSILKETAKDHNPESGDDDTEVIFKTLKAYGDYIQKGHLFDQKTYERIAAHEQRRK